MAVDSVGALAATPGRSLTQSRPREQCSHA